MTRSLSPLLTVLPMPRAPRIAFFSLLSMLCFLCLGTAASAASGKTLLVFGDSLSAAYGMPERRGWVALLEERLKRERPDYSVANASISGETTAGGLARIAAVLERRKPGIVILELGANDGLRGLPVAAMKRNLSAIIQQSQSAGARVLLVGIRMPPNYGEAYTKAFGSAFVEVAKSHHAALLPDLFEGFAEKQELFQADRIHPADTAQPAILKNVWAKLAPLLKEK
jgi:acyl-CoA thioesterase-1